MADRVDPVAPRSTPLKRVLLVGDSHGNAPWLGEVLARARGLGIDTAVQLGDFGIWPGKKGQLFLDAVAAHASDAGVTMYALGGNHDDSGQISAFEQHRDDDGFVTLRQGLRWIPRGHRWSWEGVRFGAVGGAFSIDHRRRIPGISWWPGKEEVQPEDVETLGAEPLDVLLTHDAPEGASPESMFQLDLHDMAQARKSRLLLRAALEQRRVNDALIDSGQRIERPQVILIDEVPVKVREGSRRTSTRSIVDYWLLVVAEAHWPEASEDEDPFAAIGPPTIKLRLIRALAKANTQAWRIVLDELGYSPDFVVADGGGGVLAGIAAQYSPWTTKLVPSLYHLTQRIELALADVPAATMVTPAGKALIEPLAVHLGKLRRGSTVLMSATTWMKWWDDLDRILVSNGLPRDGIAKQRANYELPMADVLQDLMTHPGVAVSTGGLETLIHKHVSPMLAMRQTGFANLERTNALFDLVVARQHGVFDDLSDVVTALRSDADPHGGWSVPLRTIEDPQPKKGRYSSLRDTTLLSSIAKQRGIS